MDQHWTFETYYKSIYRGQIQFKGHIHNGKDVYKFVETERIGPFTTGKSESLWKSEVFPNKDYKTVNGMLRSMGLPKLKK